MSSVTNKEINRKMPIKRVKMKISKKKKKLVSFSYSKDHSTQKLDSYVKRCAP